MLQCLSLCTPSAGGWGLTPGQGTRSHTLQLGVLGHNQRSCIPQLRLSAAQERGWIIGNKMNVGRCLQPWIHTLPPLLPGISAPCPPLSPEQSQCSWTRGGFPTVHPQQAKLVLLECQLDRVAFMLRTSSICPFLSEKNPKLLLAMPSRMDPGPPHSSLTHFPPPPPRAPLGSSHTPCTLFPQGLCTHQWSLPFLQLSTRSSLKITFSFLSF